MRFLAVLLCLALPAGAQTPDMAAAAAAASERLEAATAQMQAADGARNRIRALTETVLAYDDGLAALRASMRQAAVRKADIQADLSGKRAELARLLAALSTITQTPRPALLVHPQGPLGAARAGMMVADLTPALQAEVDTLQAQLGEVSALRVMQEDAAKTLSEGLQNAQTARAVLADAVSERTDLPLRFDEDPIQTALLVASAHTLANFANRMAAHTPATDLQIAPNGDLALPVTGRILRDAGSDRPGIYIATAPRALVTTPVAATLLFRGPLLDYGNVVILEPGAGVLFVFAGLQDVLGEPGQILPAGAPVGLLGDDQPEVDSFLTESQLLDGGEDQQALYLEVREGQSPVNPAAWFALD